MVSIKRAVSLAGLSWLAWRTFGPEIPRRMHSDQRRPLRIPGRTVFVGEREFFVRETGPEGATPLVLLHGWSFDGEMTFFNVIERFAERFRVVVPDHRGYGKSDWIRGRYEIADVADDVAGVLQALDISNAVVLGYSMGGMVAQELAHRHPSLVDRLVLAATAARPVRADMAFRLAVVATRAVARISRKELSAASTTVLRRSNAIDAEHEQWMWEALMRRDPNLYYEAGSAVRRFDSRQWIDSLDTPTMVIINTHDQIVPPPVQYELASFFTDGDIVEIVGARHESVMNRADEYVKAVVEFVDR